MEFDNDLVILRRNRTSRLWIEYPEEIVLVRFFLVNSDDNILYSKIAVNKMEAV